jgi:hypothetical protein
MTKSYVSIFEGTEDIFLSDNFYQLRAPLASSIKTPSATTGDHLTMLYQLLDNPLTARRDLKMDSGENRMDGKSVCGEGIPVPEPHLEQLDAHISNDSAGAGGASLEQEPLASPKISAAPSFDENVVRFANNYYGYTRDAATYTIYKCWNLVEAQRMLGEAGFEKFCREMRLSTKSAAFKKLLVIGENGARLLLIAEALPDDRQLLHRLATLPDEILRRLMLTRCVRPSMTLSELNVALGSYREQGTPIPIQEDCVPA